jgi:arylsulfatase A-like enzyme
MFELDSVGLNRGYDFQAFGGWFKRGTLRWLRGVRDAAPWYLFFHTMAVHRPYGKSHRKFRALVRRDIADGQPFKRLRQLYLRNVTAVDHRFGQLWETLRDVGALDNTIVVILSDHGEGLSVHSSVHCNPGGWQEGVCRVPIIFWCPGLVKAGQVIDAPISTVDVAPTIAQLCGMDWTPRLGFDGRSVAGVVTGENPVSKLHGRECFFFATMSEDEGPLPIMQGLVRGAIKYVSFAQVRDEQWQELKRKRQDASRSRRKQSRCYNISQLLARYERGELELLFNVADDPEEMHNLAQESPALLNGLRDSMDRWQRDSGAAEAARPRAMDEAEQKDAARRLKQLGYLD